ncbi:MAG: response regulator [Chitinophagaceae bacterium]|nr:response regulator [Anaerolineae bacterium]
MVMVLLVEDSIPNAQLIQVAMESRGIEVVCVNNGEDGVRLAQELHPLVILMDLRLPGRGMDGWAAIAAIKADQALSKIPIIVISVEIQPDDRQRAYDAGCAMYFPKPFSIVELINAVSNYVGM